MVEPMKNTDKSIVLIDGDCNFCNSSALFIIKHDKNDKFNFASQQSEIGKKLLLESNYTGTSLSTIVLVKEGKTFTKTTALIEIAKDLVGFPKMFVSMKIIPVGIRDFLYDVFSKYRYKLFGKKQNCALPTSDVKKKFLS